ncbi:MAG: hypothetical protein A2Y89_04475 [Chloroflexi bacterium RBG_13_51_18]|nr:MAG: hypothetical protein A2Y89_04475 [Chloroflexi bacterium RBG_13_51_18]
MKKWSHAWLAFMAVKRLEDKKQDLNETDLKHVESLISWFMSHKDGVAQGAWFPDELIKDMADKHVLKFAPADKAPAGTVSIPPEKLRALPSEYLIFRYGKDSPVRHQAFNVVDKNDNLPDRCESLAEAVVDQLKVQEYEDKGSPVSPTDNQVALWLFMLSHYIADAHVPVHCDGRQFSKGKNIHGMLEKAWDDEIKKYYRLNKQKTRFLYNIEGYPAPARDFTSDKAYQQSFLKAVADELDKRKFDSSFGKDNKNVWDFMNAVCHNSYLISYRFFPPGYGPDNVTSKNWKDLAPPPGFTLYQLSTAVLADAIDSISRVWFRVWRRYETWEKKKKNKLESID